MTDEFADSYDDGSAAEAVPEETGAEEASPPDVSEALQQMAAQQQQILERLDGGAGDQEFEDGDYGDQGDQFEDFEDDGEYLDGEGEQDPLRALIQQEIEPVRDEIAARENGRDIDRLAEAYPEMNEDKMAWGIRSYLEQAGLMPEDGMPDARYVEMAYKSLKADLHAAGETPAEAGGEQGATLETGAGPSAPGEEEMDPQTKSYMDAIIGDKSDSVFTR
jgi:hypothetical protein